MMFVMTLADVSIPAKTDRIVLSTQKSTKSSSDTTSSPGALRDEDGDI